MLKAESLGEERFRDEYRRAWEQPWKRRVWGACAHLMLHGAGDVGWGPELGLLPNTRLRTTQEGTHWSYKMSLGPDDCRNNFSRIKHEVHEVKKPWPSILVPNRV